jgi:hypothetical protein
VLLTERCNFAKGVHLLRNVNSLLLSAYGSQQRKVQVKEIKILQKFSGATKIGQTVAIEKQIEKI